MGSLAPNGDSWAATAEDDFGAVSGSEGSVLADVLAPGTTIEGRWSVVRTGSGESVMCYLKAKPARTLDD
jgi:hypothetical protein